MAKKGELKEIVIKREEELRVGSVNSPWMACGVPPRTYDGDIARAAIRAGYEDGDKVKYKIVVERKR